MSGKIAKLSERVAALDCSQTGRKRPRLMGETEGEAWIHYSITYLSEDERHELEQVEAEIEKGWENKPDCRDREEWQKYDDEHTRLLHRHGELIAIGEARAEAAPWEPWTRFEAEYRDAKTQLGKVKPIEPTT